MISIYVTDFFRFDIALSNENLQTSRDSSLSRETNIGNKTRFLRTGILSSFIILLNVLI